MTQIKKSRLTAAQQNKWQSRFSKNQGMEMKVMCKFLKTEKKEI